MELLHSKAQAFQSIDAFEQDLRSCIEQYLLDHESPEVVFGNDLEGLTQKQDADNRDSGPSSLTNYLGLRQAYDILLRFTKVLPRELGDELNANVPGMGPLVTIRNRVMHGRPLRVDDLTTLEMYLGSFRSRHFALTQAILERVRQEPLWEPPFEATPPSADRVLHNLPIADHEDTGLVGRAEAERKVLDLLIKGRDRMITLTGEGGIGKSALALQVAYQIVDDPNPPFEAVIWVSLKDEVLTAGGVRQISNAVRGMAGATEVIGKALDQGFGGSVAELADYLSGLATLLVIDNLESAQGSEVLDLYDELPESVTFLFTSRIGIGQIERRVPVTALEPTDAARLLRKFAARRGQTALAGMSVEHIESALRMLRYSPLAIRWFVLSVEAGRTPTDALRNQDELLRFCVDNVYEALTPDSKLVLVILRSLNRPISFDELALVSDLGIDVLRRSVQELFQGSLLSRTSREEGSGGELLELSTTARAYLPRSNLDDSRMQEVLAREAAYAHDREEHRHDSLQRVMDPYVIRTRNDDDEPTAHLLRLALRRTRDGQFDQADDYVQRAQKLNPGFFEIDRVAAHILARRGDVAGATLRYRAALTATDSAMERAVVSHFLAGHLARNAHDLPAALALAEEAHATLKNADTALALGTYLVWDRRFEDGQHYIEQALEDAGSGKFRRIVTSTLIESWRRWGEFELDAHQPTSAVGKSLAGFHTGRATIEGGSHDMKFVDAMVRAVEVALKGLSRVKETTPEQVERAGKAVEFVLDHRALFRDAPEWPRLVAAATAVVGRWPELDRAVEAVVEASRAPSISALIETGIAQVRRGTIVGVQPTYAFIKHRDLPANAFFHFGALARGVDPSAIKLGTEVVFTVAIDPQGRVRAEQVEPV